MEITLRKANAIQLAINEALSNIHVKTVMTMNEYNTPTDVSKESILQMGNLATSITLLDILYDLRNKVAEANLKGVNQTLTEIAKTNKKLELYTQLTMSVPREPTNDLLLSKIEKLKLPKIDRYTAETFVTSIHKEDIFKQAAKDVVELKRKVVKLRDKLLEYNVSTKIEIDEASAEFLQEHGII